MNNTMNTYYMRDQIRVYAELRAAMLIQKNLIFNHKQQFELLRKKHAKQYEDLMALQDSEIHALNYQQNCQYHQNMQTLNDLKTELYIIKERDRINNTKVFNYEDYDILPTDNYKYTPYKKKQNFYNNRNFYNNNNNNFQKEPIKEITQKPVQIKTQIKTQEKQNKKNTPALCMT